MRRTHIAMYFLFARNSMEMSRVFTRDFKVPGGSGSKREIMTETSSFFRFNRTSCANILSVRLPRVRQRRFDDFPLYSFILFDKNIVDSATPVRKKNCPSCPYSRRRRSLTVHVKLGWKFAAIDRRSRLVLLAEWYSVTECTIRIDITKRRVSSISRVVLKVSAFQNRHRWKRPRRLFTHPRVIISGDMGR